MLVSCFRIPMDKKEAFKTLRNSILSQKSVNILTLQNLWGNAFLLACVCQQQIVYSSYGFGNRESQKSSQSIPIRGDLKDEIEEWSFIDDHFDLSLWREGKHVAIEIVTDASRFAWEGAVVEGQQ